MKFSFESMFFFKLKIKLLALFILVWLKTLRISVKYPENFRNGILALYHEDLFIATKAFAFQNIYAMISKSKDGELLTEVAQKSGYTVIRGSSSRGAENIRFLIQPLLNNKTVAMALDGPKGPPKIPKPGTFYLAKKTKAPIWEIKTDCKKYFRLHSWDKTKIPYPFSKISVKIINFSTEETKG